MITLKLSNYSKQEVETLAEKLKTLQAPLQSEYCEHNADCLKCPVRHLCFDLAQATMYAEEYNPVR